MVPAILWLTLIIIACVAARRTVLARRAETQRLEHLDQDRTADLKCAGPPRFNG